MHDGNVPSPTRRNKLQRSCSSVDSDGEFHLLSKRMSNLNRTFTLVSELVDHLRGNNRESLSASVTRPNNKTMSDLIKYHQSFTTLKRQDKS